MRILLITQEPPFSADRITTGNALRTAQLDNALRSAGHETQQVWLGDGRQAAGDTFDSIDRLRSRIVQARPDVLLFGYWELLSLLPPGLPQPVVVDFVAPRPLEQLFEKPDELAGSLRRLHVNLARADLILTGSAEQEKLLTLWLLEAGFDLRQASPVRVVPLAAEPCAEPPAEPGEDGWTVVGGGVNWPWRDARRFNDAVRDFARQHPGRVQLALFDGRYVLDQRDDELPAGQPDGRQLMPYGAWSDFLTRKAHLGLELCEPNVERRYSQSFRSLDFLRHGLPLICNDWLDMAPLIRERQAGWTIGAPGELPGLLESITADIAEWRRRSDNALALVREEMAPRQAAQALLDWLEQPSRAARLPAHDRPSADPIIGKPPLARRLARQYRLARRVLLHRLFSRSPAAASGDAVVMVSRGDLFPAHHGAAVKILQTARGISQHGRTVHLVTDSRRHWYRFRDGEMTRQRLPLWLRLFARPLAWVKLRHYTLDLPESNAFLYLPLSDSSFFWRILYVARHSGARILQAEFPAYARPCIDAAQVLDARVVMVEHNVEYRRLRDQVAELTETQFQRFKAIEIDLCNQCDAVICVSDQDRQQLAEDGVHTALLHTIPHGIDLDEFANAEAAPVRTRFAIPGDALLMVYHGTFAYPPNRDALQQFAEHLLPGLEAAGIMAHLLAVGLQPPSRAPHPRIHLAGGVDRVAPWLKAADLAVIPLRDGGGTRMKVIDCFAAGLPVISTAKGIEGIPVNDGVEVLIADDPATMCRAIIELVESPDRAAELASAGSNFASGLDWRNIAGVYIQVFSAIQT